MNNKKKTKEKFNDKYPHQHIEVEHLFIGISGIIAAGKTTLAKSLGKVMGLPVYYEKVKNNSYLRDFYKNKKKYAWKLQIYLLNERFKQQQKLIWGKSGGIQDRTIYEDTIFCEMLKDGGFIEERDYKLYTDMFSTMSNFMKKPNLIVHLDVSPKESLKRIKMRKRECESNITIDYLKKLHKYYNKFINKISKVVPVIKVNYSEFKTGEEIAKIIKEKWEKTCNIIKVGYSPS